MEPPELEKNLSDLEDKIDRVRALYEQYFVGIEKLEPQIPRKDVDRLIVVLRKIQIRNTAMRFKFQTLIQRYNTMQQHWSRITREIENGTFKRDLIKAAARFGVDDALTAVGRKHAARLRGVVDKKGSKQAKRGAEDEFYEELSSSDLQEDAEDFDDDAPTPPPQRAPGPAIYEIPDEDPMAHATVGGFDAPMTTDVDATFTGGEPAPHASRGSSHDYGSGAPSFQIPDPLDGMVSSREPAAPAAKKGGLRWGGGGARKADPEALKRIANLAGANPDALESLAPKEQPATREQPMGRKPLLSNPIDLGIDDEDEPPPPPKPAVVVREQRKPLLSSPIDLELGLPPSEPPPPMKVEKLEHKPEPAAKAKAADAADATNDEEKPSSEEKPSGAERAKRLELQRPKPQLRPPPGAESAAPKREFGDLNDTRLREIYGQYVQSRRERNESTAGVTFEKLSDSLKSQAEKLKGKHNKRVDYEIVVKDGKTLIKPIVK